MLGGWANPHREQQTIPQGQISIPPKSFIRAYGATRLYTHSHELPALTALAQHISHSPSGIDEKRPTEKFVNPNPPAGRGIGAERLGQGTL